MGNLRKWALLGAFAVIVQGGAALAADIPETPVVALPPASVEFGSGWYLRGDIGYKLYAAPDAHFDVIGYGDMINESMSNVFAAGGGVGYKFSPWFRADFTLDYEWPSHFHGNLPCPSGSCTPGTDFSDEFADISAWAGLANVYLDIPMMGEGILGITPYVGAGVGFSRLTTTNVNFVNPPADPGSGTWPGASKWNFAWALMAGFSYNFTQRVALDVNYRYLHLGDAISGPTTFGGEPIHYDNIHASEFRVGLRWMLN